MPNIPAIHMIYRNRIDCPKSGDSGNHRHFASGQPLSALGVGYSLINK
ncbi:hypothetical protein BN1012_Phect2855 [Candidatus Phaeomarinobacter ectocarpi]|uniref:Uncharacterized protein n=1 Tax=Candidatus Phaeomarinibacter ectocarpi TaxID=1458461 RepID=X5MAT2_9HYPH|nr:hypothetical protein BN1012_Phect2855 [Candidatus Phaeomarinobacter ectocarpi]